MIVLHQLELAGTVLGERSLCPSRVNRVVLTVRCSLPVYPDERTSSEPVGMSQRCHKPTHAPQQIAFLFYHFVRATE